MQLEKKWVFVVFTIIIIIILLLLAFSTDNASHWERETSSSSAENSEGDSPHEKPGYEEGSLGANEGLP